MKRRTILKLAAAVAVPHATLGGSCLPSALKWIGRAGDIADIVGKVVDAIDSSADLWFEDHPDVETEKKLRAAVAITKDALAAVREIGNAADSYSEGKADQARENLIRAYTKLYEIIETIPGFLDDGVLSTPAFEGPDAITRPLSPQEVAAEFEQAA